MKPRIMAFTMEGCPACAMLKPELERIADAYSSCVVTDRRDAYRDQFLAQSIGVESVPTLIAYDGANQPLARMTGYSGEKERLKKLYDKALEASNGCQVTFEDV